MEISLLTFVLLGLALWMLQKGLFSLNDFFYEKIREEAERIFCQRVVVEEEKVIIDLLGYFKKIRRKIGAAVGYFLIAYALLLTSFFTIKNSDTPSPLWQLSLFAFILFLIPVGAVATTSFELRCLRNDILSRFKFND